MPAPSLLHDREFRLLFSGQAISLLGDGMVRVALPFAVLEIGGSAAEVGLVLAARTLPMVAFLLVGGVVADRVSRRRVMVAADLVRLVSQGLMAALLIAGVATVGWLAVLAGVGGAATGFFNPASTGLLPAVVAAADLQRANGLRGTAQAGGEVIGPAVAGLLVAGAGAGWALAVDALTFAVSAVLLQRLRPRRVEPPAPAPFLADLRDGWQAFTARRWVWVYVLAAALGNLFWAAWSALGPVIADRSLGGAAAWGTVLAAMGVGALAGGVTAIRMEPRRPLVVASVTVAVFGMPLALLAAGVPVAVLAAGAFASGLAMMVGNTVWESTLQRHVPQAALSRVSAYDWFGSLAFTPAGMALWGPIAVAIGVTTALWTAFGLLIASAIAVLAVPEVRALRGPERR